MVDRSAQVVTQNTKEIGAIAAIRHKMKK